jgi:sortase A
MQLRRLCRLALVLAGLALAGAVAHRGWVGYLVAREASSPSTAQVLVTPDGREIPLVQPAAPPPAHGAPGGLGGAPLGGRDAAPARGPILPPDRLRIPAIDVDWPVVLATADHLPRFRGVGWLLGSAFPGALGNLVLFGHRGGRYGTLMRLPELKPGDTFTVTTADADYRYRVRSTFTTTPDHVEVLAPSAGATATLITCTGPWDAAAGTNTLRQIVVADLVAGAPGVAPAAPQGRNP